MQIAARTGIWCRFSPCMAVICCAPPVDVAAGLPAAPALNTNPSPRGSKILANNTHTPQRQAGSWLTSGVLNPTTGPGPGGCWQKTETGRKKGGAGGWLRRGITIVAWGCANAGRWQTPLICGSQGSSVFQEQKCRLRSALVAAPGAEVKRLRRRGGRAAAPSPIHGAG